MAAWGTLRSLLLIGWLHCAPTCSSAVNAAGPARRWLIGPSEQCDPAECHWPALFSLRRCRERLLACSDDTVGCCAQRAWTPAGAAGSVQSSAALHWQQYMQPSFMILVSGRGQHDIVRTLPDGARFEA